MQKSTSLAFLAYALLFLIAVSAADDLIRLDKRNNVCPQQYKRNILGKRTYVKKCPCALASAPFEGTITGLTVFAQDECGSTTVTGFFSKGLVDPKQNNYTFTISDDCGRILHKLGDLGITFNDDSDGSTKPFAQKFNNFNLNCDKDGILLVPSARKSGGKLAKRTYCPKPYYKRAEDTIMQVYNGGDPAAQADVSQV